MLSMLRALLRRTGLKKELDAYVDDRIRQAALTRIEELTFDVWDSLAQAGIGQAVRNEADGYRILCPTKSALGRLIFAGKFERDERAFVRRLLRPGDTFIDVGANIGLFTLLAARVVGEQGRVLAFEPNRDTFAQLEANLRLNGFSNVQGHNLGLSDRAGALELVTSLDGYDAWDSFGRPSAPGRFVSQRAETDTLDAVTGRAGIAPGATRLVKIDVEGWEPFVLEGGRQFLGDAAAPTLLVEFTDSNLANAKRSARELYDLLRAAGYQLFTYDAAGNQLVPEGFRGAYPYLNLVATKDAAAVRARLAG